MQKMMKKTYYSYVQYSLFLKSDGHMNIMITLKESNWAWSLNEWGATATAERYTFMWE